MMKKLIILLTCSAVFGGTSFAAPVSVETAAQIAINWMGEQTGKATGEEHLSEVRTGNKRSENRYYYVFTFKSGGWTIVSAEDTVYPVIAYSEKGGYSDGPRPPAFDEWMKNVGQQIGQARKKRTAPLSETKDAWDRLKVSRNRFGRKRGRLLKPLLKTVWGQRGYYNDLCPGYTPAGCVATAMGQIMKYYGYPRTGVGTHAYIPENYPRYGIQSADFGTTTYRWAEMPNSVSSPNPAVATLLYHCGVSVDMEYGPGGSYTSLKKAADALKTYFDYDDTLDYLRKSDYSDDEWKDMIRAELNAGHPVLYRGRSGGAGHAFVCDGYQGEHNFHFNWGWGGAYDGYYYLSYMTPVYDENFADGQAGVFGIMPIPTARPTGADLIVQDAKVPLTAKAGTAISVSCEVGNQGIDPGDPVVLRYSLSADIDYGPDDIILNDGDIAPLLSYGAELRKRILMIPRDVIPGNWFILFHIDADNAVEESNEYNNVAYQQITISRPPTVLSVTPDKLEVPEQSGVAILYVQNGYETTAEWTASSENSWLTIISGYSGIESGIILLRYDANPGERRIGKIRICSRPSIGGPRTVQITQAGKLAPRVTFHPSIEATDVPVNENITLRFENPVRLANHSEITDTNVNTLVRLENAEGEPVDYEAGINPEKTLITVDPILLLDSGETYYVILLGVEDETDNKIISAEAVFTTQKVSFSETYMGSPGVYRNSSAILGDYDNDGDSDILLIGYDGSAGRAEIYRNDDGRFTDMGADLAGVYFGSGDWGDYDNDGDPDILLSGYDGTGGLCRVYRNDNGFFTDIHAGLPGVFHSSAVWGDYDNDGDLDVLLSGYDGERIISEIYENRQGHFINIHAGLIGLYYASGAWGDYDGDGDSDILLIGYDDTMPVSKIYQNDNGVFTDIHAELTGIRNGSAAWGDYDGDGDPDILLSGHGVSEVYENDNGVFSYVYTNLAGVYFSSGDWGDYDNDGDLDILLTGNDGGENISKIYQNTEGLFTEIQTNLTGVYDGSGVWDDYDHDGDLDILLTGHDGTYGVSEVYRNSLND
ncbi:C10 family peptidase [Desulfobacterales bacterium HSG2]|nr:C10 family peptidase [Desulfobacterales bacterium HSG2]